MSELFLKILNMSISASWLVLAVLLFRLVLKKAPKWVNVVLWGMVALRLVFPFSMESALSLIPSAETIPLDIEMSETPTIQTGIDAINNVVNPMIRQSYTPKVGDSVNPLQVIVKIFTILWIIGIAVMLVYTIISYLRLRKKVNTAIPLRKKIYQSENVSSPFVLGLIKPKIYLPFDIGEQDINHVIAHEQAHIRRKDHWWKPLGFLLLTVHWFNPLMWLAYVLLCRDIELACDEKVIKKLGSEQRADYTQALLACSANRRMIAACPLAFGEVGVETRVKSVMNYKKPAFWIVGAAIISCVVIAVCFLTNPTDDKLHAPEPFGHTYKVEEIWYCAPQYSFHYSTDTAPRYQFTSDYVMFVSGDGLDDTDTAEWVQLRGGFEEVEITTENFDNYFVMSGFRISKDRWSTFRSNIKKAWRIDIENDVNNVFYYLIYTKSGEVYLTYGYHDPEGETDPHSDDSSIRWLFKLARTDLLRCNAISEACNAYIEPNYYPNGVEWQYDALPVAIIKESGTLIFSADWNTDSLVVSEDYYRSYGSDTRIEKETYTLTPNKEGMFALEVSLRGDEVEEAVYFIQAETGVYVMKIMFMPVTSTDLAQAISNAILSHYRSDEPARLTFEGTLWLKSARTSQMAGAKHY